MNTLVDKILSRCVDKAYAIMDSKSFANPFKAYVIMDSKSFANPFNQAKSELLEAIMECKQTYAQSKTYKTVIDKDGQFNEQQGMEFIEAVPVSAIKDLFGDNKENNNAN